MEADRTVFEGIDEAAQPNEPGDSGLGRAGGGTAGVRKLSCDGIWAEWGTAGGRRSANAARRFVFSVGTRRGHGLAGKCGAVLPALATAALLACGPPLALPASAQELPKVAIAAEQDAYGLGVDDVIFNLTRTGPSDAELQVDVSLTQDAEYLPEDTLRWFVAFDANASNARLRLQGYRFSDSVTQSGTLKATILPFAGYEVGTPDTATTRMVVLDPAITVRLGEAEYRFAEGASETDVAIVARTHGELPRPSRAFHVALSTRETSGGATSGTDYELLSEQVAIEPGDFRAADGVWEARKAVALPIVDDTVLEADEALEVRLQRTEFLPARVTLRRADGSACPADGCRARVTIEDDDGVPFAPRNLSSAPGDGLVTLFWDQPADDGRHPVTKHQYRVSADAGTSWRPDWTDIPRSGPGEGDNATSYPVMELANGTEYTFELRAVNGSGTSAAARDSATPSATVNAHGICDRTPAVRDRLMILLRLALKPGYKGDCAGVTDAWLVRLTSLQLLAPHERVTALERGDFAGLSRVRSLYIVGQSQLTVLPPEVFEGLTGLEEIWAFDNGIATISSGAFRGLPRLRRLLLHDNRIARLAPGAFTDPTALEKLVLHRNRLESFPFDEFEALPALKRLFITGNPGHAYAVQVSETSLEVPLGGSATYRLRLTASPSIHGARVAAMPEAAIVGVSPGTLEFTQDDWFRSQEVTVSAAEDSPSGDGGVRHEVLTGNYAFRIADPLPRVKLRIGSMGRARSVPSLRVADARAREGVDATLGFAVTLDRAASGEIAVDYATSDGTATAGEDYNRTSGTLTFASGEREKTVVVPVLDDARDEGAETFTLTLSGASGASITRAAATGTIVNDDPMPGAWLARFGRTVAGQVVDAVGARLAGSPSPHVTVGGVEVERLASGETLHGLVGGTSGKSFDEPWERDSGHAYAPTTRELLVGSEFHLRSDASGAGPAFNAWGRVATGRFDADVDDTRMDGNVTTGIVGLDAEWSEVLAGAAVSYSEGDGTFALTSGMVSARERGRVESTLTSVYPYVRLRLSERASVWALAGAGSGEFTLTEKGGAPIRTDIAMRMGAIGARGILVPAPEKGGVALSVKSDAFRVRTSSDAVRSQSSGNLEASEADVTRVRLALAAERVFTLAGGATFTPTFEVGARHDGGDAERGTGLEVGAGVRYAAEGVTIEGSARTLVAHERSGYRERGASGSIRLDPGVAGRGLSLAVASSFGAASNGVERLWSLGDARGPVRDGKLDAGSRLETEVGYGLRAPGGYGVMTPYTGLSLSGGGGRTMRAGARWAVAPDVTAGFEASRSEFIGAAPDASLRLHLAVRW